MEIGRSSAGQPGTLLLLTLSIAVMHALIPSHWLTFAVVGRAQRWPERKTLWVAALAGGGHILMTTVFGLAIAGIGKTLVWRAIPPQFEHAATAVLLIALGLYFAIPAIRGNHGCSHTHEDGFLSTSGEEIPSEDGHVVGGRIRALGSSPTIIGAMVLGLTLSPCLDLLSVFLAASALPWSMLLAISFVLAATTLAIMLTLIWLTLRGLERVKFRWLEHNEGLAVGMVLMGLGIVLFFVS